MRIQVFHTEFIWAAHPENFLMFVFIYKIMFFYLNVVTAGGAGVELVQ